jgi:hypothetical protein
VIQPPRESYWFLMRRLLAYILVISLVGTAFWLFAFLRDLY